MEKIYQLFLTTHIAGGFTALVSGLVAMFTAKGMKAHRLSGLVYFWSMSFTCSSALVMAMIYPNPFLYTIGVFSYFHVATGYRSLKLKMIYKGLKPQPLDWTIALTPVFLLLLLHAWVFLSSLTTDSLYYVVIGLSILVTVNAAVWMKQFFKPPGEHKYWVLAHLQGMGGGYIATATAFIVTNVRFLPDYVVWLTPSIIGSAILSYTAGRYKKKLSTTSKIA